MPAEQKPCFSRIISSGSRDSISHSLKQIVQLPPAVGIEPNGKVVPAQGDGVAGNKDELPAIFLEYAGGTVLAPAVKGLQTEKGHSITGSQALHQRLLLSRFHLIELGAG